MESVVTHYKNDRDNLEGSAEILGKSVEIKNKRKIYQIFGEMTCLTVPQTMKM